mgnify:CR=1 FL=1
MKRIFNNNLLFMLFFIGFSIKIHKKKCKKAHIIVPNSTVHVSFLDLIYSYFSTTNILIVEK